MSQVLKVVTSRNEVQEILYTNIRIQESDNLEIRRQKRALKRSVSLYLRSKRRCIEALIQNNFTARDWYCTLTFTEDRLPPEKVKADFRFAYFIKQLRRQGCTDMKYLKVLEHKHGDGRFHFHCLLSGTALDADRIRTAWGGIYGHALSLSCARGTCRGWHGTSQRRLRTESTGGPIAGADRRTV